VAQELKVIAITDPASRMNNSFFILISKKFYRVIKSGIQRRVGIVVVQRRKRKYCAEIAFHNLYMK
jgi:hypothetical protein